MIQIDYLDFEKDKLIHSTKVIRTMHSTITQFIYIHT
jgi:hypothetical protein